MPAQRAIEGERDELAARLEALEPDGFGWAFACCDRHEETAREVLQLAYVKILGGQARFDGRSSFKTWLFAVIRKTAAAERRRAWFSKKALETMWKHRAAPAAGTDPETCAVAAESVQLLLAALSRLSRRQREVLHLVFYQGLSIEQAAEVLGVARGTARLHYERAKARLRELLPREAHS